MQSRLCTDRRANRGSVRAEFLPALVASMLVIGCAPDPVKPMIAPLSGGSSEISVQFDLRVAGEAANWRLLSGITSAEPGRDGLRIKTEGSDPYLSRLTSIARGGLASVEITTAESTRGPFEVFLRVGGRMSRAFSATTRPASSDGRTHRADFRDRSWSYALVEEIRIDPSPEDRDFTLVSLVVDPLPVEGFYQIGGEGRNCRRGDSVRAAPVKLNRDQVLIEVGIPPDAYPGAEAGELEVILREPTGEIAYQSKHGIDLGKPGWQSRVLDIELETQAVDLELELSMYTLSDRNPVGVCFVRPVVRSKSVFRKVDYSRRPNILLVSLDTLRADYLEYADYLQSIARQGRFFSRVWSNSNWTLPSHVSLFTSVPVIRHEMPPAGGRRPYLGSKISADFPMLAERVRDAGYLTAATTDGGFLRANYGFSRGFDRYAASTWTGATGRDPFEHHERFVDTLLGDALDRPFFLFVHTYEIHDFVYNTSSYHDFVDPDADQDFLSHGSYLKEVENGTAPSDYVSRLYASGVRRADEFVERLVKKILSRTNDAPLLVVITSDHGESFGEHGRWRHGTAMFEEQTRVPLVVWGNFERAPRGRVDAPTSNLDVAPSLLEFLDLAVPKTFQGERNRFLEPPHAPRASPIVASTPFATLGRIDQMIVSGGWKYHRYDGFNGRNHREYCFELAADPAEESDRAGDPSAPCESLSALYGRLIGEQVPRAVILSTDQQVELGVQISGGARIVAVRAGRPAGKPIANLDEGQVNWKVPSGGDTLAIVLETGPPGQLALTVDGTTVAGQLSLDALGDADSPSIFRVEGGDGSTSEIRIFARDLPESGELAARAEEMDPALIEQLKALGYTID